MITMVRVVRLSTLKETKEEELSYCCKDSLEEEHAKT